MAHRGPWQLVNRFESLVERRTGVRPNLNEYNRGGQRQRAAAKHIIAEAGGDFELAWSAIELWTDEPGILNSHPSLSAVDYQRATLVQRAKVRARCRPDAPRGRIKRNHSAERRS